MPQFELSSQEGHLDVVDLERYPIYDLESRRGRDVVRQCQAELFAAGACTLVGFLTVSATEGMAHLAGELRDLAWESKQTHTVYFEPAIDGVDQKHPAARQLRSSKRGIAYDHIPHDAPVRQLYESDALTSFVAAILGKKYLYRSADPLDAFQITIFEDGDELGWHFDRSEFSATIMYQPPDDGGQFEYSAGIRSETDQHYGKVRQVLDGDRTNIALLPSAPGTLALFRGQHALHRVTPVVGDTVRINSVLTYGERPDMRLNDLTSQLFYGRTSRPA